MSRSSFRSWSIITCTVRCRLLSRGNGAIWKCQICVDVPWVCREPGRRHAYSMKKPNGAGAPKTGTETLTLWGFTSRCMIP